MYDTQFVLAFDVQVTHSLSEHLAHLPDLMT